MIRGHFPSVAQQRLLLDTGLGRTLWDSLTITGVVEARGRRLAETPAPDFQEIVADDIANTATGHLNKGLLTAHGLDESGDPETGEGGHNVMWFAVRDLLFGKDAFPDCTVPESLTRPELGRRMPQIPEQYEAWILLLMNVLMTEVRAEAFFRFCTALMRDPRSFRDRRTQAAQAADLVDRIRQDEATHVGYLTAVVSELRSFTFNAADGSKIPGYAMIDPLWHGMVQWHAVLHADFAKEQARKDLGVLLAARPDGAALVQRFDDLAVQEAA
jgi:hypothetical protein